MKYPLVKVLVMGLPNTGKSSLIRRYLGDGHFTAVPADTQTMIDDISTAVKQIKYKEETNIRYLSPFQMKFPSSLFIVTV